MRKSLKRDTTLLWAMNITAGKMPSINSMIVQAESKMYRDKADYYKRHDRSARR